VTLPILSTVHVNANCSDLSRALAFYRDLVGLTPLSHTQPVPQDGRGFGLGGRVQWDAHLLHDERGVAGPAVDLLEWQDPRPTGRPGGRAEPARPVSAVPLARRRRRAARAHARGGCSHRGAARAHDARPPERPAREVLLLVRSDGTCVEFIEQPGPCACCT
jgi:catechol 2,3-dioxygenase-like lactoylglutathione lyase family enzyme